MRSRREPARLEWLALALIFGACAWVWTLEWPADLPAVAVEPVEFSNPWEVKR